ncbi:hypothetical protein ACFL5B_02765 [Candidatus Latescibacterota bacterium]
MDQVPNPLLERMPIIGTKTGLYFDSGCEMMNKQAQRNRSARNR